MLDSEKRLFLRLGDRVQHRTYDGWGLGVVVEVMTSIVPGGTCLVRILFEDGKQRTFNNDLDSDLCCARLGMQKLWRFGFEGIERAARRPARTRRLGGPC
jgi:hypothetical protein